MTENGFGYADRRKREERIEILRVRRSFVCSKCGGEFHTPDSLDEGGEARRIVLLGGKAVCEVCARRKRERRLFSINPENIGKGLERGGW